MKKFTMLLVCLAMLGIHVANAQQRTITGTVTSSEDNMGLPGVSVSVKGTTLGTATDIDGKYTLNVPQDAQILVFSSVGMKTQEITIGASNNISVTMEPSTVDVGEVVVTALGISRDKKAIGYAATSVKGDEIAGNQTSNPMSALQGKVAGVEISQAPGPGTTQNVMIRGASSFTSNQPLYIIDGVPMTNNQNTSGNALNNTVDFGSGINALNPNDIENMTVLKGAAATALYGSRAANGVIMITTKSGKNTNGEMKVSYDGSIAVSRVGFLSMEQEKYGQGWDGNHDLPENGNWGPAYDDKNRKWGTIVDGKQKVKPYSYLENRIRDFFEYGINYKNALSLSGGNATTNYFFSGSQNRVNGVIPGDHDTYDRYTLSSRASHQAGKLKMSSSFNFSNETNKAVPSGQGNSMFRSLYEIANDISIVDLKDYNDPFNNLNNYFTYYGVNPYFILDNRTAEQKKNKFFGKAQLDYDLFDFLKFTYRFGGDYEASIGELKTAVWSYPEGNLRSDQSSPGGYTETRRQRLQVNHDFMLTFTKDLTEDLGLNAIAGFNINQYEYSYLYGEITSVDVPGFYNLTNSLTPSISGQFKQKKRLMGAYLNLDFDYKKYLYLTLTARNDWSSTLPLDKNSFFYPGATVSFLVTDFLKQQSIGTGPVNFAKVRVAYGMTGNDAGFYDVYDRYVLGRSNNPRYPKIDNLLFPLGGVNSYNSSTKLGNSDIKPELTTEFEVGTELKFFDNRLGLDFSYYNRLTKGLIADIPIDPSSGYTTQTTNLGDIRNQGIEATLYLTPVKLGDFRWDMSINYAANKNKVEKLDIDEVYLAGFGGVGIYAVEGKPMGQYKTTGVLKHEGKIVVDGSGIPVATTKEEFVGKDINEKFFMGLSNTFSFKGIVLSATVDWRNGGYIYSRTKGYSFWTGVSPESLTNDRQPMIVPNSVYLDGDKYVENTHMVVPEDWEKYYGIGIEGGTREIIDRSYVKLRNVSLGYEFPKELVKKIGLSYAKISANVGNILLWTPVENPYIDPETTSWGNDIQAKFGEFNANPQNQVYTFGLSLKF